MKKKYIAFLITSVVCLEIVAGAYVFFFFWRKEIHEKAPLVQVASRSEGIYAMPQDVLQGLLALTPEDKQDVSVLDLQALQKRMEQCSAIRRARVRKLSPGTLVVDYALREPLFLLGEYHNIAVDRENCTFPMEPYFPDIHVPTLFLSNKDLLPICYEVERAFSSMDLQLDEVDASDVDALGLFRREMKVKASGRDLIVRLPVDTMTLALQRLSLILKRFPEYRGTIDLRYPDVAYLEQFFKGTHEYTPSKCNDKK